LTAQNEASALRLDGTSPVQHVQVANWYCRTGRSHACVGSIVFSARAILNITRKGRQRLSANTEFCYYFRALAVIKHERDRLLIYDNCETANSQEMVLFPYRCDDCSAFLFRCGVMTLTLAQRT